MQLVVALILDSTKVEHENANDVRTMCVQCANNVRLKCGVVRVVWLRLLGRGAACGIGILE